jgi:hypothetical protein
MLFSRTGIRLQASYIYQMSRWDYWHASTHLTNDIHLFIFNFINLDLLPLCFA